MKITRNPEVLSLYRKCALMLVIFLCLILLISYVSIAGLKMAIFKNNAAIIGAVIEKYPEAEPDIIKQIQLQDKSTLKTGEELLKKYGYTLKDVTFDTGLLAQHFYKNLLLYSLLLLVVCVAFIITFTRFIKDQYSRIDDITHYAKIIQEQDYSLDIRDNSEGDISMLKNEIYKITTMLREQAEILKNEKVSLSNSIADISHQIKTPITSLFVLNDLLSSNPDTETRLEFLQKIRNQLHRIEWLVSSLLKLSKLDAGTVLLKKDKVNMHELIEKALAPISIPVEIKMQHINILGDKCLCLLCDVNWTSEALTNILKNCSEHTPEKGSIQISFDDNPIYTEIIISDNGNGIDKEDIPYIFNRFYKGKNSGSDSVGIGLAMARTIILKQNGDISVKSERNIGTTFTIKFYKVEFDAPSE